MLVVAVALSTATYAWFTSNASVTASTVSMTAAVNDQDSIYIKWSTGSYGASITTTQSYGSDVLVPMIPSELTAGTTTLYESGDAGAHDIAFQTAGLTTAAGVSTFDGVDDATPVYFMTASTDVPASDSVIFIKNTSAANVVHNIKVTASFTPSYIACVEGELAREGYTYYTRSGAGTDEDPYEYTQDTTVVNDTTIVTGKYKACVNLVRVAVFTRDLTAAGTNDTATGYILRGVLANQAASTYFGEIEEGDSQQDFAASANAATGDKDFRNNTITATAGATGFNICYDNNVAHSLAAGGEVEVKVVMWLDGEALNEKTQGAIANVGLTFAAVRAQ